MTKRAAARGDYPVGGKHSPDVLWTGRRAQQNNVLACQSSISSSIRIENSRSAGVTGRGSEPLRHQDSSRKLLVVEGWSSYLSDLLGRDTRQRDLPADDTLFDQIFRYFYGRG